MDAAQGLAARKVALAAIDAVLGRNLPLDQFLDDDAGFHALDVRDRAFVRMLVATTFRQMGAIDHFIVQATTQPPTPARLRYLLRIGVAQIVFMDAPDYAVVDTSVTLAGTQGLERQKGLVNAVLRRIAREWRRQAQWLPPGVNIPQWLFSTWVRDYGAEAAALIAQASLAEAPLDFTVRDPAQTADFAAALQGVVLPTGGVRRPAGGNVTELPGFANGGWWVQDAAASLPVRLFGDIAGRTIIDLCAAPGGKTAQAAAAGAHVVALDRSAARLQLVTENMKRLNLTDRVTPVVGDAAFWTPPVPENFILLDAPCSATGTIRRHPDMLYLKTADDVTRLATLQARLLAQAARSLAPGGVLVYCTCSLQKEEGEDQIASLLDNEPQLERRPVTAAEIGGLAEAITPDGDVRLLPYHLAAHGGLDGFFIARLVKRA